MGHAIAACSKMCKMKDQEKQWLSKLSVVEGLKRAKEIALIENGMSAGGKTRKLLIELCARIFWSLRLLLPFKYEAVYYVENKKYKSTWRMWFGAIFGLKTTEAHVWRKKRCKR